MHKQVSNRKILQVLASRLPESVLRELLPDSDPASVRQLLTTLAGNFPAAEKPLQQPLFSDSKTGRVTPCTLFTDGASRGNPGEAGAGAVLIDEQGVEVGTRSLYLGRCTNNVAEYQALIAGLELAVEKRCGDLEICLDSELIVRQVQGVYKVKNQQLKPLFTKVQSQLEKLGDWKIRHVPRHENARADELANRGIDTKEEQTV